MANGADNNELSVTITKKYALFSLLRSAKILLLSLSLKNHIPRDFPQSWFGYILYKSSIFGRDFLNKWKN